MIEEIERMARESDMGEFADKAVRKAEGSANRQLLVRDLEIMKACRKNIETLMVQEIRSQVPPARRAVYGQYIDDLVDVFQNCMDACLVSPPLPTKLDVLRNKIGHETNVFIESNGLPETEGARLQGIYEGLWERIGRIANIQIAEAKDVVPRAH